MRNAEGGRRKWKKRKSTEKNGAAKQGKTADKEKTENVDFVAVTGVVPHLLFQQKPTVSLQVDARPRLLNCKVFNASLFYIKRLCAALP